MINYNQIDQEIQAWRGLEIDPYALSVHLMERFIAPYDPHYATRETDIDNPYLDLVFAMLEIHGFKL